MSRVVSRAASRLLGGLAAAGLLTGTAIAAEAVQFPGAKVAVFKDAECFDKKADVAVNPTLLGATRGKTTASCVTVKVGAVEYYVLPSAIKPPAGCTQARKAASGPQATTYGAQGASSCPGK
ncbi:MAG: hypothetical protein V4466_10375 [Pseudomonadota bacterium]